MPQHSRVLEFKLKPGWGVHFKQGRWDSRSLTDDHPQGLESDLIHFTLTAYPFSSLHTEPTRLGSNHQHVRIPKHGDVQIRILHLSQNIPHARRTHNQHTSEVQVVRSIKQTLRMAEGAKITQPIPSVHHVVTLEPPISVTAKQKRTLVITMAASRCL